MKKSGFPTEKEPVCGEKFCKIVFKDAIMYPVLPALFVLRAVYQMIKGMFSSKAFLLTYDSTAPNQSENVYDSYVLYRAVYRLLGQVKEILADNLSQYHAGTFPSKSSLDSYWKRIGLEASEQYYFSKYIEFAFPVCNISRLSIEIAHACALNDEQSNKLYAHLAEHLLCKQYNNKKLKAIYGDQALDIIKGFRMLADPVTYYQPGIFPDIYRTAIWPKLGTFAKAFFCNPFKDTENFEKNLHTFLSRYFTYVSLSEYILFYAMPCWPLHRASKYLPEFYKDTLHRFREYSKGFLTDITKNLSEFADKTKPLVSPKSIRADVKQKIIQKFTPEISIQLIDACLKHPLADGEQLTKFMRVYLRKYDIYEPHYTSSKNVDATITLYRFMLKTALDVIGHYAIALLAGARIQMLQERNTKN